MGGKDDDPRSDLDKWLDSQRVEMDKIRKQFQDSFDKEVRSWKDETPSSLKGPFERFKDFVDSNFNTFAQGFKNFPSNISELKARMQEEREARRLEELDISRRWVGTDDSPDHVRMQVERQSADERQAVKDATFMLLRESYQRNRNVPPEKILKLFKDEEKSLGPLDRFATPMLSVGGACYYKTETVENLPSTARWGWPAPKPQWLSIDWFKRSPYSPVRLEAHPDLHGSCDSAINPKWRAAFEDLLCATLDKPMTSEEKIGTRIPYGNPQSTYHGPGLEWMLSLQCRGILPPQLPSLYKPVRLFDGYDEVKRPRIAEFIHDMDSITADKSTRMYPLVKKDLELLMDEIAIKSQPPKLEAKVAQIAQSPWQVPDTEEELYDQMPPYNDLVEPPYSVEVAPIESNVVPTMTGKRYIDMQNAEEALWKALENDNSLTAARCLNVYEKAHGDVDDLIGMNLSGYENSMTQPPWYPVLMEAMLIRRMMNKNLKPEMGGFDEDTEEGVGELEPKERHICGRDCIKCKRDKAQKRQEGYEKERVKEDEAVEWSPQFKHLRVTKPDILSQLTTTHTTLMPDGTVTTKVVLKQRFLDGREEVHESVQTTREEANEQEHVAKPKSEGKSEKKTKKGWFWN